MKRAFGFLLLITALPVATLAEDSAAARRVSDDAKAIDRVAEASRRDLPVELLRRIVDEDIDLLRGKRSDGSYQYAGYERFESGRSSDTFSVQAARDADSMTTLEIRGAFVFRLLIDSPSRRLLVTKNRRIYIDHVDVEYLAEGATATKHQDVKVGAWIEPGESKTLDFDAIARQATVRVSAHGDKDSGYGNLTLTLVHARVFDHPDSPYAEAVASEKAIQRALERSDIPSIRNMASRIATSLGGTAAAGSVEVVAPARTTSYPTAATSALPSESYQELQSIEDLMTGTEAERRQGLDRLHQLLRRMRK